MQYLLNYQIQRTKLVEKSSIYTLGENRQAATNKEISLTL